MNHRSSIAFMIITILSAMLVGVIMLWIGVATGGRWEIFLTTLAAILIASSIFSTAGAYLARIGIAKYLTERFGFKQELDKAGILKVDYWPFDFPTTASKIDMLVIRASAWFGMQSSNITRAMQNQSSEIRICIMHPDSTMLPVLALKMNVKPARVREKIVESVLVLVRCAEDAKKKTDVGRLMIKAHCIIPVYTYYRFDDEYYLVWYAMKRGRLNPPLLKMSNSGLSEFFGDDFERLLNEPDSETLYDSSQSGTDSAEKLKAIGVDDQELNQIFPETQKSSEKC